MSAAYENQRGRAKAYGRPATDLVDATPVRDHVRALAAAGMGWRRTAAAAGVGETVVGRLLGYDTSRPARRLRPAVAAALLGVRLELAPAAPADGTGTMRRLRALVAAGWPQHVLAAELNRPPSWVAAVVCGRRDRVEYRSVDDVRALLDRLMFVDPATDPRVTAYAAGRARGRAARQGWATALAWDDDTIDDPAACPDLGAAGPGTPGRPPLVDLAEVDHLAEAGAHVSEIARRLGCSVGAIEQARRRARVAS